MNDTPDFSKMSLTQKAQYIHDVTYNNVLGTEVRPVTATDLATHCLQTLMLKYYEGLERPELPSKQPKIELLKNYLLFRKLIQHLRKSPFEPFPDDQKDRPVAALVAEALRMHGDFFFRDITPGTRVGVDKDVTQNFIMLSDHCNGNADFFHKTADFLMDNPLKEIEDACANGIYFGRHGVWQLLYGFTDPMPLIHVFVAWKGEAYKIKGYSYNIHDKPRFAMWGDPSPVDDIELNQSPFLN